MPKYEVKAPDGSTYDVNAPEGASEQDAIAYVQKNFYAQKQEKPAAVKAGGMLNQIPRQLGLTARYGLEGLADTAQVFTEPVRLGINAVTGANIMPLGKSASNIADMVGLPKPQTPNERVIGDATKLGFGSMGLAGAAQKASTATTGVVSSVMKNLATRPASQVSAAAGAGLASGASREAGGTQMEQFASGVLGSVAGGLAPSALSSVVDKVRSIRAPINLEGKIALALREQDIDFRALPQNVRTQLVDDVKKATSTGDNLNADALRRLADLRAAGLTPTRGAVTLDPVQITREKNLAKMGANTADEGLQGLAQIENRNNAQLIQNLNTLGADRGDLMTAGQRNIGAIQSQDDAMGRRVSDLYTQARNMPGGEIPLNRADLIGNIYSRLGRENKLAFLPGEVSDMLDTISAGVVKRGGQTFEVPFDAKALDNLMTVIATAQRGAKDGNVKAALSLVRQAIDETPIQPIKAEFGGNQIVTQQGAQFLRNQDAQAGTFMDALNEARKAAAQRFGWRESARPIEAAVNGAEPDKFIQQFVINGTASDAKALATSGDRGAIKDAIANWLKDRALNGAADEVGKFSQSAFNKAVKQLGPDKLKLFFSTEEIQAIQANARAASYVQFQPAGSAVNNSNSGALMMGNTYDWLNAIAGKVPFGRQIVIDPLRSLDVSLSQRQAQNIAPGLLNMPKDPTAPVFFGPALAATGGLLSQN